MTHDTNIRQTAPQQSAGMLAVIGRDAAAKVRSPRPVALSSAGIVHDLGNLIQVAASAINIIARSPEMPPGHREPLLTRAKASLEGAGALVRQTIAAARDRASATRDANVTACLADVATLIGMWETGHSFIVEADLPVVQCDPIALQSAILNLVFNARDAVAGSGSVTIAARTLLRGTIAVGVEIRVTDDGIGMSAETVARAFDPYFTTKSDGVGGVGLPMVERFVRDADGEILIESKLGIGTIVTLRLPTIAPPDLHQIHSINGVAS